MACLMDSQRRLLLFSLFTALAAACNPYEYQKGEYNAGAVDPANFAAPYKGVGADTDVNGYRAGRGTFTEVRAYIGNQPAGYYSFPFTDTQLKASGDLALLMTRDPKVNPYAPNAYLFDPAPPSPFPLSQACTPPRNYQYNEELDEMRLDEQGSIFTLLPIATQKPGQASTFEYIPVVAEVGVSARELNCQGIKSEATLNKMFGTPPPTGNFLLWAIIDPSSPVLRVGQTADITRIYLPDGGGPNPAFSRGQSVQKWGWFRQYYLAYIDGGYVPTRKAPSPSTSNCGGSVCSAGQVCGRTSRICSSCQATGEYACPSGYACEADGACRSVRMIAQNLYIPNTISSPGDPCGSGNCTPGQVCAGGTCQTCQSSGARACPSTFTCGTSGQTNGLCTATGGPGAGYDILQSRRRDDNYSPVCAVYSYNANTTTPPIRPLAISELPRSVQGIADPNPQQISGTGRFIYCPQVD